MARTQTCPYCVEGKKTDGSVCFFCAGSGKEAWHGPCVDSRLLMLQLARMANMTFAGIKKMVLVLELDAMPALYVESRLDKEKVEEPLTPMHLQVIAGPAPDVGLLDSPLYHDTTTIQNKEYRTKEPKPQNP